MAAVVGFWSGIMEIGVESGFLHLFSKKIDGFLQWMFPAIPKKHPAREYMAANFAANFLGLGWAATPAGLKAMEELEQLKEKQNHFLRDEASNEMCTFLILNISSLQLIPVNMIVYRTRYGSANPAAVIAPAIIATLISTAAALIFCIVFDRPGEKGRKYQ